MGSSPGGEGGKRMSTDMKKAHSNAATLERVKAGAGLDRSSTSTTQSTTSPPLGQAVRIADFLGYGQSSAVPLRHLKELVDLPGREVRRMIQAERLRGVAILSDNIHGYFLAETEQEKKRFVRSMRGRAAEIEAVADAVERGVPR